jgi:hypothetical protein
MTATNVKMRVHRPNDNSSMALTATLEAIDDDSSSYEGEYSTQTSRSQ